MANDKDENYDPNGWVAVLEKPRWVEAAKVGLTEKDANDFYYDFNDWAWHRYLNSDDHQSDAVVDEICDNYYDYAYDLVDGDLDKLSDEFLGELNSMVYDGVF